MHLYYTRCMQVICIVTVVWEVDVSACSDKGMSKHFFYTQSTQTKKKKKLKGAFILQNNIEP